jgi:hypothetical protein
MLAVHALALAVDHELFGHGKHANAPAAEYVPALQGEHCVESIYVPALQIWHTAFDVTLQALARIVPTPQTAQVWHVLWPADDE